MTIKIVLGIIIAVLLAGLCAGGHFAKTRIDNLECQIAEQKTKIAEQETKVAELIVKNIELQNETKSKDAQIADLEERLGEAEIVKEIAKIEITCTPNPVSCENEHWHWKVVLKEINGIGVELQSVTEYPYVGERLGNIRIYDHSLIEGKIFGTDCLSAYGVLDFGAGLNCQEITHIVYIVRGIDDQGHKITAEGNVVFKR